MPSPHTSYVVSEVEARLLGVLVSAETARDGAAGLLQALEPLLDDASAALAVRDRDGFTLHVLAESGAAVAWPERLAPQFAISAQPGVDPESDTLVIPLRAQGSVVGALLLADVGVGGALLQDGAFRSLLDATADVLRALAERTAAEVRRRGLALRSLDSVVQGMAHQMANPLTGASAIAQLLMEELADDGQRAAVRQMHDEMKRAFAVLHDLLELQRDTMAQDGVIDLSGFVERIVRFRGYAIREQGIAIGLETAPEFLPVRGDARALEHAILLALLCAEQRSHGSVNRGIGIRVYASGRQDVVVEITDSSAGDVPRIAHASFDLPLTTPDLHARGHEEPPDLGLVDSILRAAGGRLEVSGSKASGTSLALVLPRAASPSSPTPPS
jgi:signal transduction histidine kinase